MLTRLKKAMRRLDRRIRFGRRYNSARFARLYDEGKRFEDSNNGLLRALDGIAKIDGAVLVDVGCGTGQVADRVAGRVARYHGFDGSESMVRFAERKYASANTTSAVHFDVAAADAVPLPDSFADIVLYPWSMISIIGGGSAEKWVVLFESALAEGMRILKPTGTLAIVETVNCAHELPWGEVWHPGRRKMLAHVESHHQMQKVLFSNDWDFGSLRNVRRYAGIWFELASFRESTGEQVSKLTECTGIWWRRKGER